MSWLASWRRRSTQHAARSVRSRRFLSLAAWAAWGEWMIVRGLLAAVTSAVGFSSFCCSQLHRESIFYEPVISLLIDCLSPAWSLAALLLFISH